MLVDKVVLTGERHENTLTECQDYALACTSAKAALAVVCDGCSSAKNSDVGARVWAHTLERLAHRSAFAAADAPTRTQTLLEAARNSFGGLGLESSLSTVSYAMASADGTLKSSTYGDGTVILGLSDGTTQAYTLMFSMNAPTFLGYQLYPENCRVDPRFSRQVSSVQRMSFDSEGELCEIEHLPFERPGEGFHLEMDLEDVQRVIVCSDGVTSGAWDLAEVAPALAHRFRNERFLKPILQEAFSRAGPKWRPRDDLSLAAIAV